MSRYNGRDDDAPAERPQTSAEIAADDMAALAAEYALGTLDTDDRANVQMLMAIDPAFAGAVADWERRLGELHALVGPVTPPPATWDWIKARIAMEPQQNKLWLPTNEEIAASPQPATRVAGPLDVEMPAPTGQGASPLADRLTGPPLIALWRGRARRWQFATFGIAALAAALVALAVVRELRPELLPEPLRPQPRIVETTVEVVREIPSPRIAEYVAVLQKDAAAPAFVVTLDLARQVVSTRRLGAEPQQGKDFELWLVSDKFPAPRSLGVIGEQEFTVRRTLTGYDGPTLNAATYAVSLEPAGGSPTGAPTGPMVLKGKLVQTTPAAFPGPAP